MDEYKVQNYRAVGTSAMREASNGRSVVELVKMRTGLKLEIIEDTIEKFLTYKSIRDNVQDFKEIRKSSLIVEINSGGCDISMYIANRMVKNDEIRMGTKILKWDLKDLECRSVDYPNIMKELIETRTSHIRQTINNKKIQHFIALGGDAKKIRHFFKGEEKIDKKSFLELYNRIIEDHMKLRTEIESEEIDWYEFVPSIIVYSVFFQITEAKYVLIPDISLRDGILAELIEKDYKLKKYNVFNQDIYSLAWEISRRYKSSEAHLKSIEKNGITIFEALQTEFSFSDRDKMLLRLSAILHEIGKYTRIKDYLITSYDKISNLNILGVTRAEIMTVAHACKFISSSETKQLELELDGVPEESYSSVFKLSSILSVCDALDKSKKQKIVIQSVELDEDNLTIFYIRKQDITLEEMSFEFARENFVRTFGINLLLREA